MLETVNYRIRSAGPNGYGSKSTADQVTAIITWIGVETARVLAKRNARRILPARSLEAAKSRIVSEFPNSEIVLSLRARDLSFLTCFVAEFESLYFPLNLLT
ncbi:NAD(P)-binding Rossmann-fold superfamily protein [Actinidia rufa]|uniref:NAD(P)-binding Rossmann-fold superfamily protein n=1 Tax=Actinidia rufa TaxID=165716 RepID=A0A7J0GZV9_9ERIC|nr:NAD(P)-binding Rossmann-fold superfamily protein [Actinidia rufa]